uniref:NADH dehydrogenase subunit 6 n=1 Tax=Dorylomorpha alaskensis TaxID=3058151 RepID=UPI0026E2DE62|nr:NADH dehydrogenase subunit 6 [Dorylomorpha alaskensis]WJW73629.1 NADH dehydrogenase subunit 6 [Dorylomorpha alaskensis]
MMMNLLYSLTLCTSFMFMQMNHPLAMGLTLLVQTVLVSLITGLSTKTFWFSYILFLIFLGGMLVLFIYVTSLASNEMFSLSIKSTIMLSLLIISLMIMFYLNDKNLMNMLFYNNENMQLNNYMSYLNESTIELNKLYNYPTNMITIMLINYLLITLIVVVKITKMFYGPLRMMY